MTADIRTVKSFVKKTQEKRKLEAKIKTMTSELRDIEERVITYFERQGLQNLRTEAGTAYLNRKLFASLNVNGDGTKEAAHAALRATGLDYMVKDTVNANTLSAHVRELDANGDELPDELQPHIKVSEVFRIGIRSN